MNIKWTNMKECPVCKQKIVKIEETNKPNQFWNKKNYLKREQCDEHYFYSYTEKIHEKDNREWINAYS